MLSRSTVHRRLDARFKIGGVEAADLICVLMAAAVLNLFFGQLSFGPVLTFTIPAILFFVLYFGKRGKPENYLVHLVKYHVSSGKLYAGQERES